MLRLSQVASLLALAACSDDVATLPCAPGNVRAAGGACVAPAASVVVDGDTADWAEVPVVPVAPACRVDACEGLAAEALQLARGNDSVGRPALAFRVRLAGGAAPPLTGDFDYVVELRDTAAYPSGTVDRLSFGPAREPRYVRNGFELETPAGLAPPFELELTADGFEGSIATAGLPFPFGARLSVYAVADDPTSPLRRDLVESAPLTRTCWAEASAADRDPCAGEDTP